MTVYMYQVISLSLSNILNPRLIFLLPISLHELLESLALFFGEGFSFFLQSELTTRCIDSVSHSMTDSRGDSCLIEGVLEFFDHDLRCRLESIPHYTFSRIVRDEVHMCELALEEFRELMSILGTICHSVDHDIFIEYSLIRLLSIGIERCHKGIDRIRILDWHDTLPSFVVRSVERDCE
jgi:hypothetical protein